MLPQRSEEQCQCRPTLPVCCRGSGASSATRSNPLAACSPLPLETNFSGTSILTSRLAKNLYSTASIRNGYGAGPADMRLACGEVIYWAGDSVACAIGFYGANRIIVGRARLKVVQAHAENRQLDFSFWKQQARLRLRFWEIKRCGKCPRRNRSTPAISSNARCAGHPTRRQPPQTRESGQRLA